MKQFLAIALLAVMVAVSPILMPAMADSKKDDIVVKVSGMVCDFCAQSLTKVFSKEESVAGIDVSLDDQTVTVDTKEGATLSDEKIKELIEWGGYDLIDIKRGS